MSVRTLRRRLRDYGLSRRNSPASQIDVWNAVNAELSGPGLCMMFDSLNIFINRSQM